jgi:hypothetical protein
MGVDVDDESCKLRRNLKKKEGNEQTGLAIDLEVVVESLLASYTQRATPLAFLYPNPLHHPCAASRLSRSSRHCAAVHELDTSTASSLGGCI